MPSALAKNEKNYPKSKGHVLRSAAVALFDGKPPKSIIGLYDLGANKFDNSLITDTDHIPVKTWDNVYEPDFNKLKEDNLNESSIIDKGVN